MRVRWRGQMVDLLMRAEIPASRIPTRAGIYVNHVDLALTHWVATGAMSPVEARALGCGACIPPDQPKPTPCAACPFLQGRASSPWPGKRIRQQKRP